MPVRSAPLSPDNLRALRVAAHLDPALAARLAPGPKQVTHGRLDDLQAGDDGGLRYVVDGEVLHLWPLAWPFDAPDLAPDQRIGQLAHLAGTEIALHWLQTAPQQGLLLEAHYPEAPPASRSTRPAARQDHRRALWRPRSLILLLAAVLLVAVLISGRPGLTLAIGLAAGGTIALLGWLQLRRQARSARQLTLLTGPVTESFRTLTTTGAHHWYRVGGVLLNPGMRRSAHVAAGQRACIEFLAAARPDEDDTLIAFGPAEGP